MLYKGDTLYLDWLGFFRAQQQPFEIFLFFEYVQRVTEAGNGCSIKLVPEEQLSQWLHFANSVFNRLEDLPVPTLSAVNGYALGGGCECVLATDYRLKGIR
jgi:hypothetical protein